MSLSIIAARSASATSLPLRLSPLVRTFRTTAVGSHPGLRKSWNSALSRFALLRVDHGNPYSTKRPISSDRSGSCCRWIPRSSVLGAAFLAMRRAMPERLRNSRAGNENK